MLNNLILMSIISIIYLITHFAVKNKEKGERLFVIVTFVLFFILLGFRSFSFGNDTKTYVAFFEQVLTSTDNILKYGYFENGYVILNILLTKITTNPRVLIVLLSLLNCLVMARVILKESHDKYLSVIMYIGLMFLYDSTTMLRQFLALTIVVAAYKYVKERKIIKFALLILLASQFHTSSLICFIIYPLYKLKLDKKIVIGVLVLSILCTINIGTLINLASTVFKYHFGYTTRIGNIHISNIIYTLMYFVIFAISYYFINIRIPKNKMISRKNKKEYNDNNFYCNMFLVATCINCLGIGFDILSRIALYFNFFAILGLPNILKINLNKKYYFYSKLAIIFCVIVYSSVILIGRPQWYDLDNYTLCFFEKGK